MKTHQLRERAVIASRQSLKLLVPTAERLRLRGSFEWECWAVAPHHADAKLAIMRDIATVEAMPLRERMCRAALLDRRRRQLRELKHERVWREAQPNLVVTVGGNYLLDNGMAGSAYTAAFYLGLIGATSYTTGPALADTMAAHGGWAEFTGYSQGARPTAAWSAASAKAKAFSGVLTYTITGAETLKGSFLNTVSTKGGTLGTLFSAGTFADQPVVAANTVTANYSIAV